MYAKIDTANIVLDAKNYSLKNYLIIVNYYDIHTRRSFIFDVPDLNSEWYLNFPFLCVQQRFFQYFGLLNIGLYSLTDFESLINILNKIAMQWHHPYDFIEQLLNLIELRLQDFNEIFSYQTRSQDLDSIQGIRKQLAVRIGMEITNCNILPYLNRSSPNRLMFLKPLILHQGWKNLANLEQMRELAQIQHNMVLEQYLKEIIAELQPQILNSQKYSILL